MSTRHGEPEPIAPKQQHATSRGRYAAANPAHTVRFKPKAQAKILAICERTGLSYNQAVNSAVDGLDEAAIDIILARGEELGFQKGVKDARVAERAAGVAERAAGVAERAAGFAEAAHVFRITVPCRNCGQPIELRRDDATVAIRALIAAGFEHTACPGRLKYTAL